MLRAPDRKEGLDASFLEKQKNMFDTINESLE